jgi:DNA-binding MarR family transcriptional regulator
MLKQQLRMAKKLGPAAYGLYSILLAMEYRGRVKVSTKKIMDITGWSAGTVNKYMNKLADAKLVNFLDRQSNQFTQNIIRVKRNLQTPKQNKAEAALIRERILGECSAKHLFAHEALMNELKNLIHHPVNIDNNIIYNPDGTLNSDWARDLAGEIDKRSASSIVDRAMATAYYEEELPLYQKPETKVKPAGE